MGRRLVQRLLPGRDRSSTSVTSSALAFVGLVMAGSVAIQLVRTQRGKLTTEHAAILGLAYGRSSSWGTPPS